MASSPLVSHSSSDQIRERRHRTAPRSTSQPKMLPGSYLGGQPGSAAGRSRAALLDVTEARRFPVARDIAIRQTKVSAMPAPTPRRPPHRASRGIERPSAPRVRSCRCRGWRVAGDRLGRPGGSGTGIESRRRIRLADAGPRWPRAPVAPGGGRASHQRGIARRAPALASTRMPDARIAYAPGSTTTAESRLALARQVSAASPDGKKTRWLRSARAQGTTAPRPQGTSGHRCRHTTRMTSR